MANAFEELVDTRQLMSKIRDAEHPEDSNIDAIYVPQDGPPMFMQGFSDSSLEELVADNGHYRLKLFFLNVGGETDCERQYSRNCLKLLNQKAGMSSLFLSLMYQESEWVGRFGNGCFVNHAWSPKDTTFEMIYYHCEPELNHLLVDMKSTGTSTTYFVVNPPPSLYQRLKDQIESSQDISGRLFFPDILIADEVLKKFSETAAEKWEELASLEQDNDGSVPPSQLFPCVEELSFEWLCLAQGLTSTSNQLSFLLQSYKRFYDTFSPPDSSSSSSSSAGGDLESEDGSSAVLIGLTGREDEMPCSAFTQGADDLLGFLMSKCQGQSDWVATTRESTRMLMENTQGKARRAGAENTTCV